VYFTVFSSSPVVFFFTEMLVMRNMGCLGWLTYAREYNSRQKGNLKHYHGLRTEIESSLGLWDHAVQLLAMSTGLSSNFFKSWNIITDCFLCFFKAVTTFL
jgi:hypothetical protein